MLEEWNKLTKPKKEARLVKQKATEETLLANGIEKYWKEWERVPDEGKPEQRLLLQAIEHLTEYYQKWIDNTTQNKKSPDWLAPLLLIGAQKMADITIRNVIRIFLNRQTLNSSSDTESVPENAPIAQQVAKLIADDICNVVAFRKAKNDFSTDWRKQSKFIKTWTPKRCRAFAKKMGTMHKLGIKQKEDLGHNMLRIALSSDILVSRVHFTKNKKKILLISLAPWIIKALQKQHEFLETMSVVYRPMISPPIAHTQKEDGGFISMHLRKRMVKRYLAPNQDNKKIKTSRPPDLVLQGLNALMNTEWAINKPVFKVMQTMFENDYRSANLPAFTFKDFAFNSQYPKEGTKEEKAKWMKESNEAWSSWYKEEQTRSRMLVRLVLAKKMLDAGFFYMPYTLDFRGRSYTVCELLSCQGMDFDKGLLLLAHAVPQTPRGLFWIKVHLANLFDQDKISFVDRVAWVDNNMAMLKLCNNDPYTNQQWVDTKIKKNCSFQRLAAIYEIFRTDGLTQLNVQMDGANNGVQHWAAIMQDKKLANLTNLTPSKDPVDFYQTIADETSTFITANKDANTWYPKFITHWNGKISRAITKRPTMCDAYGLTFYGMQKYIKEEGHVNWVPKEERGGAIVELARAIKGGLGETMYFPNKGKEWLREVAVIFNGLGKPLSWTTPSGFEVFHIYNKIQERVSYAQLFNKQALLFVGVSSDLDQRAQFLGVSPNWIHSLDAAHQFLTIGRMRNAGIPSYSFIHDSYGTHAIYVDIMNQFTREEFIKMHKENQLEALKNELETKYTVKLPELPTKGETFDLSEVLESAYFFS